MRLFLSQCCFARSQCVSKSNFLSGLSSLNPRPFASFSSVSARNAIGAFLFLSSLSILVING